ncbi:hypothetical protein GUITHDRAFT_89258 [Guillardia theta CCMP2712]|uniref:Major facilitator superfamily (MFS) profile domain-containing protein n=1 Tax=Guillardia theta (strain CCMP2712) TaxID=905079 RepID=L1IRJ9_GUITC|nr:hypothetical protein GUITHDRAFT_89258 [Guillardia theta CCMP2712]EKX38858.1 hypothetical protein GUITHDRAFT_89258 [Guillardia theta CCMP2712]|eukprot:XP_005825838.1 hypothetical protein GUITHDRAFT_89258 [Guillardia theta CCMP2712]
MLGSLRELNHNVRTRFIYDFFIYTSSGMWGNAMLSVYLLKLTNSTKRVGFAEGAQGVCMAISALPAGYLADKFGRSRLLKVAVVVGLLALTTGQAAIWFCQSDSSSYISMLVSLCLWGTFTGISNPALEALFADSVESGRRSSLYTWKATFVSLANATGPTLNVALFLSIGNSWTIAIIRPILSAGMMVALVPIFLLCFFSDRKALDASSEGHAGRAGNRLKLVFSMAPCQTLPLVLFFAEVDERLSYCSDLEDVVEDGDSQEESKETDKLLGNGREDEVSQQSEQHQNGDCDDDDDDDNARKMRQKKFWIPAILICSDIIAALASGMTIKFFPLFFQNETNLEPVFVNVIYIASPLMLSLFAIVAQRVSLKIGRMQVCLMFKIFGILLLCLMGLENAAGTIFSFSCFFLQADMLFSKLLKSVTFDFVTKADRAKWASLDSISRFGWSGSAVVGGILIDKFGYGETFFLTAAMQACGAVLYLLVIPLVPVKEEELVRGHDQHAADGEEIWLNDIDACMMNMRDKVFFDVAMFACERFGYSLPLHPPLPPPALPSLSRSLSDLAGTSPPDTPSSLPAIHSQPKEIPHRSRDHFEDVAFPSSFSPSFSA